MTRNDLANCLLIDLSPELQAPIRFRDASWRPLLFYLPDAVSRYAFGCFFVA